MKIRMFIKPVVDVLILSYLINILCKEIIFGNSYSCFFIKDTKLPKKVMIGM